MLVEFKITFEVDRMLPPPNKPIHDALAAIRALRVEAPTEEVAEHYATLIIDALEKAGA